MINNSISLIIPAFNEEASIESALKQNIYILMNSGLEYEIIIIDDGSSDNTKRIIDEVTQGKSNIIFRSKLNGGFGSAVKAGIKLATKDYIMYAPVDNPLDKSLFDIFCSHLGKADILVSYRTVRRGYSSRMKLNSGIYHFLISKLFGLSLKDYNWIHIYKRTIFKTISVKNERIFMLAELIIKAKWEGFTFYEFPVEMKERIAGRKTAASFKVAFYTFIDLILFYFKNLFTRGKKLWK